MKNTEAWEDIHGFSSSSEFERFKRWLANAVDSATVITDEAKPNDPIVPAGFDYEIFLRVGTGERWLLVVPEMPFRGSWTRLPAA